MRRRALVFAALAAATLTVTVTGCGGSSSGQTAASSTSTTPANPDDAFKLQVQQDGLVPAGNEEAADALVGVAKAVCDVRDAGGTRNSAIRQLAANSDAWDEAQAGEFLGYAEKFYCPKYVGKP